MRLTGRLAFVFFLLVLYSVGSTAVAGCADRIGTCDRVNHLCDHETLGPTIRRNCAETCTVCTPTTRHTCMDNPRCTSWVSKGYCLSTHARDEKRQMCPQACNLCPKLVGKLTKGKPRRKPPRKPGRRPKPRPRKKKPRPRKQPRPKRPPPKKPPPKKIPPKPSTEVPYAVFKQNLNEQADPCTDFYEFTCGNYIAHHQSRKPSDNFATFNDVEDRVKEQQMTLIMDTTPGTIEAVKNMQTFRNSCFDVDSIAKERSTALWASMQSIGQGFPMLADKFDSSKFELQDTLLKMTKASGEHFLYDIQSGRVASGEVVASFSTADLMVTSPSVYQDKDAQPKLRALQDFLAEIIALIAYDQKSNKTFADIATGVEEVMEYEKKLASIIIESENKTKSQNVTAKPEPQKTQKLADLKATVKSVEWDKYLQEDARIPPQIKEYFKKDPNITLYKEDLLKEVDAFHTAADKKVLANYLFVLFTVKHIPYLDDRFVAAGNHLAQRLDGSTHKSERKDDCYDQILGFFPLVSDHLYAKNHLNPNTVAIMDKMIEDLRNGMSSMFQEESWMAKKSKDYAVQKVAKMRKIIGVVDDAKDEKKLEERYKGITFSVNDTYLQMSVKMTLFNAHEELMQLVKPELATEAEAMRDTDVNAMHIWEENKIFMSAAILQPPFLDPAQPAAINYGSIGFIVGHEMTHGFDTGGSQYDEDGKQRDWWDADTKSKFDDGAKCFIDLYGKQVEPQVKKNVDGELTIPENIADNGGIRAAFKAYKRHLNGKRERAVKGYAQYTNEQTFFISYGTSFCSSYSKEQTEERLKTDSHSPTRFRVNVVLSNYPEFAKAWKCKKGTPMNPVKQCAIW